MDEAHTPPRVRNLRKDGVSVGQMRNRPCPCGSKRKWKKCCMKKPVSVQQALAAKRTGVLAIDEVRTVHYPTRRTSGMIKFPAVIAALMLGGCVSRRPASWTIERVNTWSVQRLAAGDVLRVQP